MRLQLAIAALAALALAALARDARADGTLAVRGVYYKERATRVMQPMLDGAFEAGARGLVTGHFLVDAITSASQSSGAVDAEPFTERRYELGLGYTHQLDHVRLGATTRYSSEPDYKSIFVGGRAEAELGQKNTLLGLGGGLGRDTISGGPASGLAQLMLQCDPDVAEEQPECELRTYSLFASVSQILTRTLVVGVSADLVAMRGFQANPYRSAIVGTGTSVGTLRERHPDQRNRTALAASARYFVRPTETTLVGAYRYYRDDWKLRTHTPEIRAIQQIGEAADATFRYRLHRQTQKAFFYEERYEMVEAGDFVSDDVKLSKFTSHTMEAKLGVLGEAFELPERWAGARLEVILQYLIQNNRFGNAIVAHAAITIPFPY